MNSLPHETVLLRRNPNSLHTEIDTSLSLLNAQRGAKERKCVTSLTHVVIILLLRHPFTTAVSSSECIFTVDVRPLDYQRKVS